MNKEELRKFVKEDLKKEEQEIKTKIISIFYSILKVNPDSIDIHDTRSTSSYFSEDFFGCKCTLDGAKFYVGESYFEHSIRPIPTIYQVITITFKGKKFFKNITKEKKEYIRIRRPSDIVV